MAELTFQKREEIARAEQERSRTQVQEFLKVAQQRFRNVRSTVSEWFGRPDDELQAWAERGRAIAEIEDSMGYRLIMDTLDKEIENIREELETGTKNDVETRGILKGLRFTKSFILTVRRDADISNSILAGRDTSIAKDTATFVRNARVE